MIADAGRTSTKIAASGLAAVVLTMLGLMLAVPWSPAQVTAPPRGVWSEANKAPAAAPPARSHAAIAYDPNAGGDGRGRVVLFGGTGFGGTLLHDTWLWDGVTWTEVSRIAHPTARSGAVMAFDGTRLVLFGGETESGINDDMWLWNAITQQWEGVPPSTRPPARAYATMVRDERSGRLVLFGGVDQSRRLLHDTWLWDPTGAAWSQPTLPPGPGGTSAVAPPARRDAAMAYDAHPDARHVVLFGGRSDAHDLGDTWVWDGTTWVSRTTPPQLQPRAEAAMAFDPKDRAVVLFGGRQRPVPAPGQTARPRDVVLGDTWVWDGSAWVDAAVTAAPLPRSGAAMASFPRPPAEPAHPEVVLFGGRDGDAADLRFLADTLGWDGTSPIPTTTTSTTTPSSTSTSTTVARARAGDGFGAPLAAGTTGGGNGPQNSGDPGITGGDMTGGDMTGGDMTGGARSGDLDTSGAFESSAGDASMGFFPGSGGATFEGAAGAAGLAAAPPPPVPAGAGTPPPADAAFVGQGGNTPNAAPVGAAAPEGPTAPMAAERFLMVGAGNPAALAAFAGAGLMFGVFCFQVVRRPRQEPALAWATSN